MFSLVSFVMDCMRLSPQAKLNKQLLKLTRTIQERTLHENTGRSLSLRGGRTGDGLGQAEGLGEPEGLLKDQEQEILDLQQRKTDLKELSQMAGPLSFLLVCLHLSLSISR